MGRLLHAGKASLILPTLPSPHYHQLRNSLLAAQCWTSRPRYGSYLPSLPTGTRCSTRRAHSTCHIVKLTDQACPQKLWRPCEQQSDAQHETSETTTWQTADYVDRDLRKLHTFRSTILLPTDTCNMQKCRIQNIDVECIKYYDEWYCSRHLTGRVPEP